MTPAFLRAHRDRVVDVALFLGCVAAMLTEMLAVDKGGETVAVAAAIVLVCTPVLVRRRWPVGAFAASMALLFVLLSTSSDIYNTIAVAPVVCGYTLADRRGRRSAVLAAVWTLPLVVVILQIYSPHPLVGWDTVKNLGLVVLPLALGVAAHERRCYTAALVERAEAAERSREEETLRRLEQERLRIARDVHDVVAHAMVAINVQAGVGAHLIERDPDQARTTLREIKRVSGEALGDLRAMLGLLRNRDDEDDAVDAVDAVPVHPTQGLAEIDDLRESLDAMGIEVAVAIDPAAYAVPAAVGATGYRIVQEALTNVMRHVGPTSASVRITRRDEQVVIEVEDDGGAAPAALVGTGSGNGLRGMRERAAAVGGTCEAGPRDGGGWRVAAVLPS